VFFFFTISVFFSTTVYASISSSFSDGAVINGIQENENNEGKYFITS
jgi:hypothetical protein